MTLEPMLNRIIVMPTVAEKKATNSNIIVIEDKKPGVEEGTVVACGKGARHTRTGDIVPMSTVIGDTVLFSRMSSTPITFGDKVVYSIFETDIIGIIRN
jgi:co-chaperonin GroES (HSP10)